VFIVTTSSYRRDVYKCFDCSPFKGEQIIKGCQRYDYYVNVFRMRYNKNDEARIKKDKRKKRADSSP